jgi:hypothetical protein
VEHQVQVEHPALQDLMDQVEHPALQDLTDHQELPVQVEPLVLPEQVVRDLILL